MEENPFDSIISSFSSVSLFLENTSDFEFEKVINQTKNDSKNAENILLDFSNAVGVVSNTLNRILQSEAVLKTFRENLPKDDFILLSHNLQAKTVDSIKQIYNFDSQYHLLTKKDLWNEKSKDTCVAIQKQNLQGISEAKNIKECILYNIKHLNI